MSGIFTDTTGRLRDHAAHFLAGVKGMFFVALLGGWVIGVLAYVRLRSWQEWGIAGLGFLWALVGAVLFIELGWRFEQFLSRAGEPKEKDGENDSDNQRDNNDSEN